MVFALCFFLGGVVRVKIHVPLQRKRKPSLLDVLIPTFNTILILSTLIVQQCTGVYISSHPEITPPQPPESTALEKTRSTYHVATRSSQMYIHAINQRLRPCLGLLLNFFFGTALGKLFFLEHDVLFMWGEGWESCKAP